MSTLDHLVLKVNDVDESVIFYTQIMGFALEGYDGPFCIIRVSRDLLLLLSPHETQGGEHYAFAFSRDRFEAIFDRIKMAKIPFGSTFDSVGENANAGEELGARGLAPTLYFYDPNDHLLEIRTYE